MCHRSRNNGHMVHCHFYTTDAQAIKSKFIHESDQGCIQYGGKFWLNPIKMSLSDSLPLSLSEANIALVWYTTT